MSSMTAHDALTEAVQTMLDSVGTPGKSDCPHCGDGRTAINWLSDIERVRVAFEGVRAAPTRPSLLPRTLTRLKDILKGWME